MIVVFPFSVVDQELALKNVQWMNELGGCKGHDCLLIYDFRCRQELVDQIQEELKKCFSNGSTVKAEAEIDGWPQGANYFMRLAACKLQSAKYPYFLWMEPDAIPLREGWLEAIDNEFKTVAIPKGKRFMGDRVEVEKIPLHLSGVAIYSNPLHAFAGEAYRAHDEAWDMAGRHQIVPAAHFTKLIEHAWRHPTFHHESELQTQIRPEAVLFHSSKDGSLIDLLKSKRAGKQFHTSQAKKEREEPRSPCPILSEPTTDIFIRTYPGDYPWLAYCVLSIHKFCTGFRKIRVVSPEAQPSTVKGVEWKIMNDETPDGYLAQQITKLYADVITDYQADYILHVDSDVIFTRPTTPDDFLNLRKPIWYYTPYEKIDVPWKPITEKFMGGNVENEFMRRFPIIVPRWLYPRVREFCNKTHGVTITDYIKSQPQGAFSEFNALGAYAWVFHRDKFFWWNTIDNPDNPHLPEPHARQFRSWDGITPEVQKEIQAILTAVPVLAKPEVVSCNSAAPYQGQVRESTTEVESETNEVESHSRGGGQDNFNRGIEPGENPGSREPSAEGGRGSLNTPSEKPGNGVSAALNAPPHSGSTEKGGNASCSKTNTTGNILVQTKLLASNAAPTVQPAGAARVPAGIKELPNGIWVIENDTHISKWIEQQGRLDHDQNLLPLILPEIGESDVVVDAGAFVGDHTVAYMKAVPRGFVYAFEPNPLAFQCLKRNIIQDNVNLIQVGLSDSYGSVYLNVEGNNHGGLFLSDRSGSERAVVVMPLDVYGLNPNFVKLDVEGFELKALQGMERTIRRCHPKLVIEINRTALDRQDADARDIFRFLENHGYELKILQENCGYDSPMFDILAIHEPVEVVPPSNGFDVANRVRELRKYADASRGNSVRVGQQLSKAGFK